MTPPTDLWLLPLIYDSSHWSVTPPIDLWLLYCFLTPPTDLYDSSHWFITCSIAIYLCAVLSRRGSLLSTAIFVYAATGPINGYFGGSLYSRMGGNNILPIYNQFLIYSNIETVLLCCVQKASIIKMLSGWYVLAATTTQPSVSCPSWRCIGRRVLLYYPYCIVIVIQECYWPLWHQKRS